MLRFLTAGESHGRALMVIVEGLPAGLPLTVEEVQAELARRRLGFGRGPRMRFEQDDVTLVAGVRHGTTLGAPVGILIGNTEWPKWEDEMSPAPGRTERPLTQPRPGHADLAGMQKYGFDDARNVLERASARETAARVAAGTCAKALLARLGVSVLSHVVQLGPVESKAAARPEPHDLARVDESPVRCFDREAEAAMIAEVKAAAKAGDSVGGGVEVLATIDELRDCKTPPAEGRWHPVSHVRVLDTVKETLHGAGYQVQSEKYALAREGFEVAGRRGSEAHDEIVWDADERGYHRPSARAGGIEGGITNGEVLVARVAMKPLSTLNRPVLRTVDVTTKEETVSFKERTDVTAVPAMGVVAETMVALVLASEALRKFGGDSVDELVRNRDGFLGALE